MQINNEKSSISEIVCGVPHGSILGQRLFNLCINDFCDMSYLLKFVLLANDIHIKI